MYYNLRKTINDEPRRFSFVFIMSISTWNFTFEMLCLLEKCTSGLLFSLIYF